MKTKKQARKASKLSKKYCEEALLEVTTAPVAARKFVLDLLESDRGFEQMIKFLTACAYLNWNPTRTEVSDCFTDSAYEVAFQYFLAKV